MYLLPEHQKNERFYLNLLISSYLLYTISIAIKMVYSAQMVEIGPYFGVDKSQLSIGLTIYYIVYAIAQVAFSFFIKKISIKNFIGVTVVLSGVSFALMGIITELWQAWLILALNGVLQIGIWGGCMSIFAKYMPDYTVSHVTKIMSTGMASGTALAYGFSALFTAVLSWKWTFIVFGILSIATVIYFVISEKQIEENVGQIKIKDLSNYSKESTPTSKPNGLTVFFLVFIISIISMVISVVYYGLTNWVPSLLKDVYGVPSSYSILITLLIPLGTFFGPFFANHLCDKNKNYFVVGIPLMIVATIGSILMVFFYDIHIIFAILSSLVILFFVRGFMNVLLAYIPLKIRNYIETGKLSLILNAVACVSAAATPYFSALIMENFGWSSFFVMITVAGAVTLAITIFSTIWANKKKIF